MRIPEIQPDSFLEVQNVGAKQTIIARGEGINFRHLVNLVPCCLLGLVSVALIYFSFSYLIFGNENKLGVFGIGLVISLAVAAFALIAAENTIQAVWGTVTLTIDSNSMLRVVHSVPIPLMAGDFYTDDNPLRIALCDVENIRTLRKFVCPKLLVSVKRRILLPTKVHCVLSCRSVSDLAWLHSWIESNRAADC